MGHRLQHECVGWYNTHPTGHAFVSVVESEQLDSFGIEMRKGNAASTNELRYQTGGSLHLPDSFFRWFRLRPFPV